MKTRTRCETRLKSSSTALLFFCYQWSPAICSECCVHLYIGNIHVSNGFYVLLTLNKTQSNILIFGTHQNITKNYSCYFLSWWHSFANSWTHCEQTDAFCFANTKHIWQTNTLVGLPHFVHVRKKINKYVFCKHKRFLFKAPSDWNNLPANIQSISSFHILSKCTCTEPCTLWFLQTFPCCIFAWHFVDI